MSAVSKEKRAKKVELIIKGTPDEISHILQYPHKFPWGVRIKLEESKETANELGLKKVDEVSGNWVKSIPVD